MTAPASARYALKTARLVFAGLLAFAIRGSAASSVSLENEAFLFTEPGFEREGKPVWASGADTGRIEIVVGRTD